MERLECLCFRRWRTYLDCFNWQANWYYNRLKHHRLLFFLTIWLEHN
jgi:hypothetical protein